MRFLLLVLLLSSVIGHLSSSLVSAVPSISNNSDTGTTAKYEKFEATFAISNTTAQNFQFPFDPAPPAGIDPTLYPKHRGITVDAVFTSPSGQTYPQPAFIYQPFVNINSNTGYYPEGNKVWKVRFAPHETGTWSYYLKALDASGSVTTQNSPRTFLVTASTNKGFIRVSPADPRYFEFSDGTYFPAIGRHSRTTYDTLGPMDRNDFLQFGQNGITLVRDWMSGFYGSAWLNWKDGRNTYDYYLPRTGLEGIVNPVTNKEYLTMVLQQGGSGWYYNCRRADTNPQPVEQVKPNKYYKIWSEYWASGITGPRLSQFANFGYTIKIGGWQDNCGEPGGLPVVTTYGLNSPDTNEWSTISGTWNSGSQTEARLHLALENATNGKVWIKDISLKECLDGQACSSLGPELLNEPSGEYESYYPERSAYEIDKAIEAADDANLYLKLVVGDKSDMMWWKMQNDDGTFVTNGEQDVQDGFYGDLRKNDKKRFLWDSYFRYLTARWGYSTAIHSWELTNEGVGQTKHFVLTDEMGKAFGCRAFGIQIPDDLNGDSYSNGKKCAFAHPNRHLVTTSFDHSLYPFWLEPEYPNVDYGDVHAYSSSTGWLSGDQLTWYDAAHYHIAYSQNIANSLSGYPINKPVIRGEAGIDLGGDQNEASALHLDTKGVWLHNYTWASLHSGGLIELYWWDETIDSVAGPDGNTTNGLMEIYQYFHDFVENIPLNNSHYVNSAATLSNTSLRVVGQKDTVNNRTHLWIQNKNHTWRNIICATLTSSSSYYLILNCANASPPPLTSLSGTVTLTGFSPNRTLPVEWHQFTTSGVPTITTSTVTTNSSGTLVLSLPTNSQIADVGIKIGDYSNIAPPPTSPTPPQISYDLDNDSDVDFLDLFKLITGFNTPGPGNFNLTGLVDIFDFNTLISNL